MVSECAAAKRPLCGSPVGENDPNALGAKLPTLKKARLNDDSGGNSSGGNPPVAAPAAAADESSKRERLLFLLQVASDPRVAGIGLDPSPSSSTVASSLPGIGEAPEPSAGGGSAAEEGNGCNENTNDDDKDSEEDEEDEAKRRAAAARAKQRRIQFALSVLNSPTAENEARLKSVVADTEQTMKSVESSGERAGAGTGTGTQQPPELPLLAPAGALPSPTSHAPVPRKRHHVRKRTFPEKLMAVLSDPQCEPSISWLPNGNSFVIVSPHLFTSEILPKYFKSAKFESFTRKLNRWGYKRITKGTSAVAYSHALFRRDRPELVKQMKGDGKQQQQKDEKEGKGGDSGEGKSGSSSGDSSEKSSDAPPPLPEKAELEEELRRELEIQRRMQRQAELAPRPPPPRRPVPLAPAPAVSNGNSNKGGSETNGAREAASALDRLSASFPSGTAAEQRRTPPAEGTGTTANPKSAILPRPGKNATDYTSLSATLKETMSAHPPSISLTSMLSRLDHGILQQQQAFPSATAATSRAHQSRAKLQNALRGGGGVLPGSSSCGVVPGAFGGGGAAAGLPFGACGPAGGGGGGLSSSGGSSALAMYYNRKMQQITARYSGQLGAAAGAGGWGSAASASAPVQQPPEERRSYLHRIRENLESNNQAA